MKIINYNLIYKLLIPIVVAVILSSYINSKIKLNYNYIKLDINIDQFKKEDVALANLKSKLDVNYSIVGNFFDLENIRLRINKKIIEKDICVRDKQASKRNPNLVFRNQKLKILIIFSKEKNAVKCENEIKKLINENELLFKQEIQDIISHPKYNNKLETSEFEILENMNKEKDDDIKIYILSENEKERILENLKNVYESKIFDIKSQKTLSSLNSFINIYFLTAIILILTYLIIFRKILIKFASKNFK